MKIKPFSDDAYGIIKGAEKQAAKYYHTFFGANHIFLSMFGFLSANKESERYKGVYNTLKTILNKYNVNGKEFETAFLMYCPRGTMPNEGESFTIAADNDYVTICENLKRRAVEERRSMEVEDLITELFADRSYSIAMVLAQIVGSDMKADELRAEIVKAFKRAKMLDIKELSQLPEMTNLNEWVKKHPQKIIGVDEDVNKVMMALAGRSIRNAMITGPAGTGKTSVVYELAQRINSGEVPEFMQGKILYELNSTALVAGTR